MGNEIKFRRFVDASCNVLSICVNTGFDAAEIVQISVAWFVEFFWRMSVTYFVESRAEDEVLVRSIDVEQNIHSPV